jgi:hypothetical protein
MGIEQKKAAIVAVYQIGALQLSLFSVKFGYNVGVIHKWVRLHGNQMNKPVLSVVWLEC